MAGSNRVDDFLKALDKTQVVLTKARPPFAVAPKNVSITNYPDLGNTVTPEYSPTEKAIQYIENLDSLISNAAVGADLARKIPWGQALTKGANLARNMPWGQALTKGANLARNMPWGQALKGANLVSKVGGVAEPVQMALWSADAARTMADPEYRHQSKVGVEQMLDEDRASPVKAALKTASAIFSRPVGTISGLLSTSEQIALDQINQDLKGASLDRQARDRADREAVPEITADTIKRDRALKYFNR